MRRLKSFSDLSDDAPRAEAQRGWTRENVELKPWTEPRRPGIKLFCRNLNYDTTDAELRAVFDLCGVVLECHIFKDGDKSRGFAVIRMADDEGAKNALALHGMTLDGREIRVERWRT